MNELFKNDRIALVEYLVDRQQDYVINEIGAIPQRGVLLPYRVKNGKAQFMVMKSVVEGWDVHSDIYGFHFSGQEDLVDEALALSVDLGFSIPKSDVYPLGVVAENVHSNRVFSLFAARMTDYQKQEGVKSFKDSEVIWINTDELLKTVDACLLASFARLNEYF